MLHSSDEACCKSSLPGHRRCTRETRGPAARLAREMISRSRRFESEESVVADPTREDSLLGIERDDAPSAQFSFGDGIVSSVDKNASPAANERCTSPQLARRSQRSRRSAIEPQNPTPATS